MNKELKDIIFNLIKEIEEKSNDCEIKKAYSFLFGSTNYSQFLHEKPLLNSYPYFNHKAYLLDEEWRETLTGEALVYRGRKSIPVPKSEDINIYDHLLSLSNEIYNNNEKRDNWLRSLNSFLNYLLEDMPEENRGILESIFPYKKEIRADYTIKKTKTGIKTIPISIILRKIENEEYPIDILVYSDIIKTLINICLYGLTNAQKGAAETLGLIWMCFNNARMRLFNQREILFSTPRSALEKNNTIILSSLYGQIEISLSETIYKYLKLLSKNSNTNTILSKPLDSLYRIFKKAVDKSPKVISIRNKFLIKNKPFANITFKTMMQMPHEAFGHRSFNR